MAETKGVIIRLDPALLDRIDRLKWNLQVRESKDLTRSLVLQRLLQLGCNALERSFEEPSVPPLPHTPAVHVAQPREAKARTKNSNGSNEKKWIMENGQQALPLLYRAVDGPVKPAGKDGLSQRQACFLKHREVHGTFGPRTYCELRELHQRGLIVEGDDPEAKPSPTAVLTDKGIKKLREYEAVAKIPVVMDWQCSP
jgi:hypothetical protein